MPAVFATVAESAGCAAMGLAGLAAAAGMRWYCSDPERMRKQSEVRQGMFGLLARDRERWIERDQRRQMFLGRWVVPIVWAGASLGALVAAVVVLGHP